MTVQQILNKAIEKAIAGRCPNILETPLSGWLEGFQDEPNSLVTQACAITLIFNHDFAKALWGKEPLNCSSFCACEYVEETHTLPAWQIHLQQMAIADDPIKYLGENI